MGKDFICGLASSVGFRNSGVGICWNSWAQIIPEI